MYVGLDLAFEKKLHGQAMVQESSGSSSGLVTLLDLVNEWCEHGPRAVCRPRPTTPVVSRALAAVVCTAARRLLLWCCGWCQATPKPYRLPVRAGLPRARGLGSPQKFRYP